MTDKQIVEAMAKVEGYRLAEYDGGWWGLESRVGVVRSKNLPDYLTSHDACQRVLLVIGSLDGYMDELSSMFNRGVYSMADWTGDEIEKMMKATPREKCEAILKAKGLWQKD